MTMTHFFLQFSPNFVLEINIFYRIRDQENCEDQQVNVK